MKIFRPEALSGSSPPTTENGFGIVWDSATGATTEVQWAWPARFQADGQYNALRLSDGKITGISNYNMEADGNNYVSSFYVSDRGPGAIQVLDIYDNPSLVNANSRYIRYTADKIVLLENTYLVADYSGTSPAWVAGDSTAWRTSAPTTVDHGLVVYADGSLRMFTLVAQGTTIKTYLSSVMDGTALTLEFQLDIPAPEPVDLTSLDVQFELIGAGGKFLEPLLALGGEPKQATAVLVGNINGMGVLVQGYGQVGWTVWLDSGYQTQVVAQNYDTEGNIVTFAFTIASKADGSLDNYSSLQTPVGLVDAGDAILYPDTDFAPPVVPPFWRGFLRAAETI